MKKIRLLSSSLAALVVWSEAASQAAPPSPELAACIRDNAPKVEQAIPNLNEALSYLVYGVCSAPLNDQYEQILKLREQQRRVDLFKMCEKSSLAPNPSDKSGKQTLPNLLCSPAGMETTTNSDSIGEDVRAFGQQPRSAEAMSLAARALLDLRLAHQNSRSP